MTEPPELDTSSLEDALIQFRRALGEYQAQPKMTAFRDSVVIHFIIVYNLMVQMIFRYVRQQSLKFKHSEALSLSRAVRRALDMGVLRCEWEQFSEYAKSRNSVAHIYNLPAAERLILLAPDLQADATFLLEAVKERLHEG